MLKRMIPESWAEKHPPSWAAGGILCITKDHLPGMVTISLNPFYGFMSCSGKRHPFLELFLFWTFSLFRSLKDVFKDM